MATLLTAGNILDRVRVILKDVTALDDLTEPGISDRRWSDTEMLYWVSEGYRIVIEQRPDFYVMADGTEYTSVPIPDDAGNISSINTYIQIHPQKAPALIDFVLSRGFAKDSETGNNDLSTMYLKLFYEKLK
jgi:hypothetical protein